MRDAPKVRDVARMAIYAVPRQPIAGPLSRNVGEDRGRGWDGDSAHRAFLAGCQEGFGVNPNLLQVFTGKKICWGREAAKELRRAAP
jgi:hypothetical protein